MHGNLKEHGISADKESNGKKIFLNWNDSPLT